MELVQRFTQQVELVCHRFDLVAIAIRQRRPQFRCRLNALTGLRQDGGVIQAKTLLRVVHALQIGILQTGSHCLQHLRLIVLYALCGCAEKIQLMQQRFVNICTALGFHRKLHDDAGS